MDFFNRQYRFSAGQSGSTGFEVSELHISFSVQKSDAENPNNSKITLWNLSKEHLAVLEETDCVVSLRAGYGDHMPLIFVGAISYVQTSIDGSDRMTEIEAVDGRVELRDSFVSLAYGGKINTKKIIEDGAAAMGASLVFSHNAVFSDIQNGFSFIGKVKDLLSRACSPSGLTWSLQNGVLQVKMAGDTMSRDVYVLSAESGLIGIPKKITLGAENDSSKNSPGYEVEYLMNGAIGIDDYVRLESERVSGYFRVASIDIDGDNLEGSWTCTAKILEV